MIAAKTSVYSSRYFYGLVHWRTTFRTFHDITKIICYLGYPKKYNVLDMIRGL